MRTVKGILASLALVASMVHCSAVQVRVENFTTNKVAALIEPGDPVRVYSFPPGITDFSFFSTNATVNVSPDELMLNGEGYGNSDSDSLILRLYTDDTQGGSVRARLFTVTQNSPALGFVNYYASNRILDKNTAYAGVGITGLILAAGLVYRRKSKKG